MIDTSNEGVQKRLSQMSIDTGATRQEEDVGRWEHDDEKPDKKTINDLVHILDFPLSWPESKGRYEPSGLKREMVESNASTTSTDGLQQWERDALTALRGMDDNRRRRALHDLEDGAELARLKKTAY